MKNVAGERRQRRTRRDSALACEAKGGARRIRLKQRKRKAEGVESAELRPKERERAAAAQIATAQENTPKGDSAARMRLSRATFEWHTWRRRPCCGVGVGCGCGCGWGCCCIYTWGGKKGKGRQRHECEKGAQMGMRRDQEGRRTVGRNAASLRMRRSATRALTQSASCVCQRRSCAAARACEQRNELGIGMEPQGGATLGAQHAEKRRRPREKTTTLTTHTWPPPSMFWTSESLVMTKKPL